MTIAGPETSPARASRVSSARRLLAGALAAGAVTTGVFAVSAPSGAGASSTSDGSLRICVRGTHGHQAKITVSRRGQVVESFKLAGCDTRTLPVGKYRITERAPAGYRVDSVTRGSGVVTSGEGQISAISLHPVRPAKRIVTKTAWVDDEGAPSISFHNRRAQGRR